MGWDGSRVVRQIPQNGGSMNPRSNRAHLARIILWFLATLILGVLALVAEGQTKPAELANSTTMEARP